MGEAIMLSIMASWDDNGWQGWVTLRLVFLVALRCTNAITVNFDGAHDASFANRISPSTLARPASGTKLRSNEAEPRSGRLTDLSTHPKMDLDD